MTMNVLKALVVVQDEVLKMTRNLNEKDIFFLQLEKERNFWKRKLRECLQGSYYTGHSVDDYMKKFESEIRGNKNGEKRI